MVYINLTGEKGGMHLSMHLPKPESDSIISLHVGIRAIGE
jgi:hypothetical protein